MISEVFPTANPLKISDISKLFNIPISALRYYEKEGLCHFKRSGNNYRFADIRTIRNLCDISFYRKLSCSIEQLHQLDRMDHRQIYQLLAQSRQKLQRQLQELHQMLENIDEKMERIAKIDALSRSAAQVVLARLPAIYRFDLFCSEDISNLIRYERDLFVIVESNGSDFGYGLALQGQTGDRELLHPQDTLAKPYLKVLLKTDYEHIEQNNLQQFYEQIFDMGYSPGRTFGKVLVSAQEQELTNFYEAWIELISA